MTHEINLVNQLNDISYIRDTGQTQTFWNNWKKKQSFHAFYWLDNRNELDIIYNSCSLNDVKSNPNKKYYFIYYSSEAHLNELSIKLNDNAEEFHELIDLFKQENLRIIFIDEAEGVHHEYVEQFSDSLKKLEIPKERILYINNDALLPSLSENLNLIGKKWNFLFSNTSNGYIEQSLDLEFKNNREFIFLTKNKILKPHRILILAFLKQHDLLKISNYSSLIRESMYRTNSYEKIQYLFGDSFLYKFKKYIEDILEGGIVETKYEKGKYNIEDIERMNYAGENDYRDYESSYINITTESNFNFFKPPIGNSGKFLHISEKSLKPFAMMQLPIIVGVPHHIKYMRELYNLDMFDDFIDHSYDNETDDVIRMTKLHNEILRLSSLRDELPSYYKDNESRIIKNRKIIKDISKWKHTDLLNFIIKM